MATTRKAARQRIHRRIRKKVAGTAQRPRLAVHFSGKNIYAQVIDDDTGRTIAAASTAEARMRSGLPAEVKGHANKAAAELVGKAIAELSLAKNLDRVVFDRGGFLYHGKVKALADAARAGGLKF
jgi:large subunit ribosomal protein L18